MFTNRKENRKWKKVGYFLKELRNYKRKLFLRPPQIGENTTNILKLLFFIINLHSVTSNQISTYRKLNLPLTSSIYFIFLPLEMRKKTRTDQSIPRIFLLYLKRKDPQTFKSGSCKKSFFPVCMLLLQLAWRMFFLLCDNWKTLLFIKACRCSETFLRAMLLLSLKPVF